MRLAKIRLKWGPPLKLGFPPPKNTRFIYYSRYGEYTDLIKKDPKAMEDAIGKIIIMIG